MAHIRLGACLSLTGRFAQFGNQAASGLRAWAEISGHADVHLVDDQSRPERVGPALHELAQHCDLLLGPYSTQLMRRALAAVSELGCLIWNHGGSGDDVETALTRQVVSIPSPTSRYAEPFIGFLASQEQRVPLTIVEGKGSFGRQVAVGAIAKARENGLTVHNIGPTDPIHSTGDTPSWDMFSAGVFEDDVARVNEAMQLPLPPRHLCSVAAGVQAFADHAIRADDVFGVAQWMPGARSSVELGPDEETFTAAYLDRNSVAPDYPAVQAAAAAILAEYCSRAVGGFDATDLWRVAGELDTSTLYGDFRIDSRTGAQIKHRLHLVHWRAGRLERLATT